MSRKQLIEVACSEVEVLACDLMREEAAQVRIGYISISQSALLPLSHTTFPLRFLKREKPAQYVQNNK
jgi:hypothetical protein